MIWEYKTIRTPLAEIITKEKGSKFIGFAFPVENLEEVKKVLEEVKLLHPKATHYCYAYRLGIRGEQYRANDDGEPSGSAGLPIFNQILAHDLTDIIIISVRYYGGTKLGVSGLVKAYKESAKLTLEACEMLTKELESDLRINFPFDIQNNIFTLLGKFEAKILDFQSEKNCFILARIKSVHKKSISEKLSEMPNVSFEI